MIHRFINAGKVPCLYLHHKQHPINIYYKYICQKIHTLKQLITFKCHFTKKLKKANQNAFSFKLKSKIRQKRFFLDWKMFTFKGSKPTYWHITCYTSIKMDIKDNYHVEMTVRITGIGHCF